MPIRAAVMALVFEAMPKTVFSSQRSWVPSVLTP
jgi:hypothetical protein